MTQDPFAPYLQQADAFFAAGDVVKAGQIWQAILKREPAHAHAREGFLKVKAILERQQAQAPAPAPDPVPAPAPAADLEQWVRQGCTLYDMGQVEEALRKWEEVLAVDPHHAVAADYARGARKELGLAPGAALPTVPSAPSPAPPPPAAPTPAGSDAVARLLREAAQLYDMGVVEEAMAKWRGVLDLEPGNEQAQSYLALAEKEEAENQRRWAASTNALPKATPAAPPAPPQPPQPPQTTHPAPEASLANATLAIPSHLAGLDPHLAQARHLLETGHADEAAEAYRLVLQDHPDHAEAREGLARAQEAQAPRAVATLTSARAASPVAIPPKVTGAAPSRRAGLELPDRLRQLELPPWVKTPQFLASVVGGLVVVIVGINIWRGIQRDRQLEADVRAARRAAQGPVARATSVTDLAESPASILAEGQEALRDDPVRAYHRAREVLRRSPGDGAAAQLLERARLSLVPLGTAPPSREAFESALRNGDLPAAEKALDGLLRADPDSPELLRRAGRVFSTLAQMHALSREWKDARIALQRGRALAPQEPAWNARLRLLDRIETQPKSERPGWIALL